MSIVILGLCINWFAGFFTVFYNNFLCGFLHYFFKKIFLSKYCYWWCIWCLSPVIGYVCSTGSFGVEALILFGIIFLWTPPHFWALALKTKLEYKLVNIPMLPNIKGDKSTKWHIFLYTLILVIFSTLPYFFDFNSIFYLAFSLSLGFKFLFEAYNLLKIKNYDVKKSF